MAWGKTTRLLLIWPETDDPLLDRRLDLLLLKRRAVELGAQLAFVTRDPEIKSHARELGIPVYRTTREAQAARWRIPRTKSPLEIIRRLRALQGPKFILLNSQLSKPNLSRSSTSILRIPAFLIALLSVAALAGLLFPSATITLSPATRAQTLTFTAFTSPAITTLNASGAIPTHPIQVSVEGRLTVETTGNLTLPNTPATGRVTFTNLTDVTVIIPKGTIVLTADLIRFATDRQALVSAQAGGTVEVAVTAIQPGTNGNVEAEAIQSVEGSLGLQLTATNALPTTGGTNQTLSAPTEADRRRAYGLLLDSLRDTAAAEILAQLSPGDILLNPAPVLLQTLEETYTPAETEPSNLLEVALRLEFQSLFVPQTELYALAQTVLDASLASGYLPVGDTLTYDLLTIPISDEQDTATWEMKAERTLVASLPERVAIELALGQPAETAQTLLAQSLPLSSTPHIHLSPWWWPRMPYLPFQIEVQTEG